MAQFTFSMFSPSVGGQTFVTVMLPIGAEYESTIQPGEKFQTLWLLHGGGGNSSEWARMTDIERIALNHKLAVVMPDVGSNFYSDLPNGPQYFKFVADELPAFLRKHFPMSDKREDNFVAGLSMGGFGAAKCAFNYPERYGAVGLMSTGPMNPIQLMKVMEHLRADGRVRGDEWYQKLFGGKDKIPCSCNDIWFLLERAVQEKRELPLIYDCCGTEDMTYAGFLAFQRFARRIGLDVTFEEGPGCHDWDFWEEYLHKFIAWLPLLKNRNYFRNYNISTGSLCAPLEGISYREEFLDTL